MKRAVGRYSYKTDVGRIRIANEDQALALTNPNGEVLLLVCDGMGGQNYGELASRLTRDIIAEEFEKKPRLPGVFLERVWLRSVVKKANTLVYNESKRNPMYKGMGTTLTICLVSKTSITIGQVGDSRAYMLIDNKLCQITEDQTYVAYLYRSGQISESELKTHPKRHVLLNALGVYPSLSIDIFTKKYEGQPLLLCSDGLYNSVNPNDIESIIRLDDLPQQKCDELVSLANANGGSDNIAIVYWEVLRYGD